jgi:hypothetical protein
MDNDLAIAVGKDRKGRNMGKPQGGFRNAGQDRGIHGGGIDQRDVIETGRIRVIDQDLDHFSVNVSATSIALRTEEERPRGFIQHFDQIFVSDPFFCKELEVA